MTIERERERETKIIKLKSKIRKLEDIIARTPEQEKKLKKLKEQLDQLEKEKQQQTPNKTN